jgi:hypothetical protein
LKNPFFGKLRAVRGCTDIFDGLSRLQNERGLPKIIRTDNGKEFLRRRQGARESDR